MIGTITATAAAAAPHVGPLLVTGGKALAGFAVAAKASRYAQTQVQTLVDRVDTAREDAKQRRESEKATDNVTPVNKTA